ncbi:MAG: hypothetical protein ACRDS0_10530 [Pseudonocardiaceae bacterium]
MRGRSVSAVAGRHRRGADAAYVRIPGQQRGPCLVGITDAHTHVEHLVSGESVAAHRPTGHYLALCGMAVLAASLTDPGRGWCRGMHAVSGAAARAALRAEGTTS